MTAAPRSRASRSTSAARCAAVTAVSPVSGARSAASRPRPMTSPITWSASCGSSQLTARTARHSQSGRYARPMRSCHDQPFRTRGAVLLPVLRGRGPGAAGRRGRRMALPELYQVFSVAFRRNGGRLVTEDTAHESIEPLGCTLNHTSRRFYLEDRQQMRSLADQAAEELETASAEDIIRWATGAF